jgi:hypothetical protein
MRRSASREGPGRSGSSLGKHCCYETSDPELLGEPVAFGFGVPEPLDFSGVDPPTVNDRAQQEPACPS